MGGPAVTMRSARRLGAWPGARQRRRARPPALEGPAEAAGPCPAPRAPRSREPRSRPMPPCRTEWRMDMSMPRSPGAPPYHRSTGRGTVGGGRKLAREPAQAIHRMGELGLSQRHRRFRCTKRPRRVAHLERALDQPAANHGGLGKPRHALGKDRERPVAAVLNPVQLAVRLEDSLIPLAQGPGGSEGPLRLGEAILAEEVAAGAELRAIGVRGIARQVLEEPILRAPR